MAWGSIVRCLASILRKKVMKRGQTHSALSKQRRVSKRQTCIKFTTTPKSYTSSIRKKTQISTSLKRKSNNRTKADRRSKKRIEVSAGYVMAGLNTYLRLSTKPNQWTFIWTLNSSNQDWWRLKMVFIHCTECCHQLRSMAKVFCTTSLLMIREISLNSWTVQITLFCHQIRHSLKIVTLQRQLNSRTMI